MRRIPIAIRFFLINILVSISAAIFGIIYQGNADTTSVFSVLKYVFGLSLFYFPFVLVSSVVVGIPALYLFRKMNWANSPLKLGFLGGITGSFACFLIFAILAGRTPNIEILPALSMLGGTGGIISGLLWWLFVEHIETKANPNA